MENILKEISNINPEDYKNSWSKLKELSGKAKLLISEEDVYQNDCDALSAVVRILTITEGAESETYLYHTFRRKREHAIEAILIYLKRKESNFKYGITL